MLRSSPASPLLHLSQRAPLALALPLLAAYAPEAFSLRSNHARGLHVFARRPHADYAKVEVGDGSDAGDLKDAVIAKLKLGAPPDSVRLLRAVEGGGAPVPLDSRRALADQGVREGTSVMVEVLPAPRSSRCSAPLESFSNVLALAPSGAHSPQQLQALASLATRPQERVRALNQLLPARQQRSHPGLSKLSSLPLFETQAHLALLDTLVRHASQLASGAFVGDNGSACRTLVGARGIGKTALLRAFACVAASAFPSVITLYVSGAGLTDSGSSFRALELRGLIEAAAAERGVVLGGGDVADALEARGLRLLLLLDEVDELYKVSASEPALRSHVLQTLGMLGTLGDGTSGVYGVLLCGSSSSTYTLVCGGSPGLGEWFPLVQQGVPDLNSDKFTRWVVPFSSCTAVGEVARMLGVLAGAPHGELPQALLSQARLFTFFVGSSPRAVKRALRAVANASDTGLASATPEPSSRLSPRATALYSALLAKLQERNGTLRAHVMSMNDKRVNLVRLKDWTVPWEDLVTPLSWAEVQGVWTASAGASAGDTALLRHLVHELADHQLFQLRGNYLQDETLWPVTAVQVAVSGIEQRVWAARDAVPVLKDLLDLGTAALKMAGAVT